MGCDIHCHVEVRTEDGWKHNHPLSIQRNYNLFAILADVRNGVGFAGLKTGEGFNIICEPRGTPDDVSVETAWDVQYWEADGHSHSWITLQELLDFDWDQVTHHVGVVSPNEYQHFKEHGFPSYWSAGVSGATTRKVSNEEMEAHLASGGASNEEGLYLYTTVTWKSTYRDSVGSRFFDVTLAALKELGNPEDVRLVFFFDN